ncbi:spore maturation protein [Jeotgalibacillus sp. R-1-5s-1]|uniref:spore maturation protein n=1 Tax=Jeotgalibacillus sp. R-1-5s-1 TaxID=2555897 RepID=UPI00106CF61D|nr:nucleoside recognition domain-containing protein [Jeotgalibacillus sp. R-1-5s-1]TFE00451.1 spore maturation protein [Jeotgalibacillus sp. R-1-5s-1]
MAAIQLASGFFLPTLILIILITALCTRTDAFGAFVEGGKEGLQLSIALLPYLLGMLVAISVLRASGILDLMTGFFSPVLEKLMIPSELLPLFLTRPISGSASLGIVAELTNSLGPDHMASKIAAVVQGSTDTTLYILTVYFGAVGIRKMGRALTVGLLADFTGMIAAVMISAWYFGFFS